MGGAMLWQSHLTPLSPGMDPTQAKLMRYMPLIFLVFFTIIGGAGTLHDGEHAGWACCKPR